MCGFVRRVDDEGNDISAQSLVTQPIEIGLAGTTFGALRYGDNGEIPVDVPGACPDELDGGADADAGADVDADAGLPDGGDTGDAGEGDGGLRPPAGSLAGGVRADATGRFYMQARIAGAISLSFVVDTRYHEEGEVASLDGSLRSVQTSPAAPAIAQFSTPVDENGEFVVVIPDLRVQSEIGEVVAALALRAIIVDADRFCGVASGRAFEPLQIDLAGTTLGAVRIPADSFPAEAPENAIDACP